MALSLNTPISPAPRCQLTSVCARNDAFSFWKLPEEWRAELQIATQASEAVTNHYLMERYLEGRCRRPPSFLRAYYPLKSLIPAAMRHLMNSVFIRNRGHRGFPHWPCESALLDFWSMWLRDALNSLGLDDGFHVGFWPQGKRCCVVLTHDVDSARGFTRIGAIADLEERYGFRSAWYLPLQQYPIDWRLVEELRSRGFEFGAHGLNHDGKLFSSPEAFAQLAPIVERLAGEHDLRSFRAPSTLRRAEWIARMAFESDSSFSDTDPYEPQPGGTCSIFPFFLSNVVELPYTLSQDHTLINLLKRDPLLIWTAKAKWIASLGGMILLLTHPDYFGTQPYLGKYEELLRRLRTLTDSWCALPSEVAQWWRHRSLLKLITRDGSPIIFGPDTSGAVVTRLGAEPLAQSGQSTRFAVWRRTNERIAG